MCKLITTIHTIPKCKKTKYLELNKAKTSIEDTIVVVDNGTRPSFFLNNMPSIIGKLMSIMNNGKIT